jgi:hypothetical protein
VTLVLTFVLGVVAFTAFFWGLSLVIQGWLYSGPADRLPLRALAGGLAISCFLTGWVYANTRLATHKDKYGTLFEFTPSSVREVAEFKAIRQNQSKKETQVDFTWTGEVRSGKFVEKSNNTKEFKLNTSEYLTVALLIPDTGGKEARFDAELEKGAYKTKAEDSNAERWFREKDGSRYLDGKNPRLMLIPSTGALLAALALNFAHFALWILIFWLGLRYQVGHGIIMTLIFGLVTMLIIMPLLFNLNAVK